jgi:mannose-6-phosphate isomerase-like protein (cupin superfamily)
VNLPSRAIVVGEDDLPMESLPDRRATFRAPVTGSRQILQRVYRYLPGPADEAWMHSGHSEDVLYVVEGRGQIEIDARPFDLEPGAGVLVPPGNPYRLVNPGPGELVIVSVVSPPPEEPDLVEEPPRVAPAIVHERDQEPLPAGDDRSFRLMIEPRHGCRNVTQFIGSIDRSMAPFHTHAHEEAIYVLSGRGIVHVDDQDLPIEPGTSIFLPAGTPHCLENRGPDVLRVLGVFSPPGSPADKREGPGLSEPTR